MGHNIFIIIIIIIHNKPSVRDIYRQTDRQTERERERERSKSAPGPETSGGDYNRSNYSGEHKVTKA